MTDKIQMKLGFSRLSSPGTMVRIVFHGNTASKNLFRSWMLDVGMEIGNK